MVFKNREVGRENTRGFTPYSGSTPCGYFVSSSADSESQNISQGPVKPPRGFTLVELLVVISIISLLSSVVFASVNSARAKGRDAKRFSDLKAIETALQRYYDTNGFYPTVAESGDGSLAGWRVSYFPNFLAPLAPYLSRIPADPTNTGPPVSDGNPLGAMFNVRPDGSFFYMYYNYDSGTVYGCPWSGPFSVVGFRAVEGVSKANLPKAQCGPQSPPCPGGGIRGTCRDWSTEFDYSVFLVR